MIFAIAVLFDEVKKAFVEHGMKGNAPSVKMLLVGHSWIRIDKSLDQFERTVSTALRVRKDTLQCRYSRGPSTRESK